MATNLRRPIRCVLKPCPFLGPHAVMKFRLFYSKLLRIKMSASLINFLLEGRFGVSDFCFACLFVCLSVCFL